MASESERYELVQRAVEGDAEALQRLIVHYHGPLCGLIQKRMAAALRRHVDAEDVLQQAYVNAFKAIGNYTFDGAGGFYAWLKQIAVDRLKQTERDLRRKKRDIGRRLTRSAAGAASSPDLMARLSSPGTSPSRSLARDEASAAVISSMARLTDDQRAIVRMRFLEDKPVAEIAAELGKTEAAIHMLSFRGLKALRELMGSITQYLTKL